MLIPNKFNGRSFDGSRRLFMGGGGGGSPAPSQQTVNNTSIPDYARPYVENMLGQTAALTDINQNPYESYQGQRIAGFTPMQAEAFQNVANQQVAGQIGEGSNLASAAGTGMLGTTGQAGQYGQLGSAYGNMAASMAPQAQQYGATGSQIGTVGGIGYGAQGAGYGQTASQAGNQYAQMATNPYAMQAYMNPYVQSALNPQLQMMDRQNAQTQQKNQAQAVAQGAFGGNRGALVQSQNQFYNDLAKQDLIAKGYNTAFNQAQQAQQFGANLGLQGQQTAIQGANTGLAGINAAMQGQQLGLAGLQQAGNLYGQGMTGAQIGLQGVGAQQAGYSGANQAASTLGQLGQTQFGQEQAINNAQLQAGAVQQAQQQQGIDVQYQDYLKQQNYPYQQLAFMSDMTRGLPLSQSAQTQYTAAPNTASQAGGLGMTALGIYGMSGGFKANGGMVGKGYAKGGQVGYATGGDITMMTTKQLTELLGNPSLKQMERDMIEEQLMLRRRMEMNPEAGQIMAPATQRSGIGAIATGEMVPEQMAGGGIVAFAQGGSNVKKSQDVQSYQDFLRDTVKKRLMAQEEGGVDPFAESKAQESDIKAQLAASKKSSPWEALAMAGLGTMSGTSQYGLTNLGLGGIEGLKSYGKSKADQDQMQKLLLQQGVEREKSKYARDTANLNSLQAELGRMDTKEIGMLNARNAAGATASAKQTTALIQAQNAWNSAVDNAKDTLLKQTKFSSLYRNDPAAFNRAAKAEALTQMSPAVLEILGMKPSVDVPTPGPAAAPAKSYPPPTAGAISALKSRKDIDVAKTQFDAIFGPGAAQKVLGK